MWIEHLVGIDLTIYVYSPDLSFEYEFSSIGHIIYLKFTAVC